MENKHTLSDLYQMQSLPLTAKIRMTEYRIRQWIEEFGRDGVYVAFSGGKDSTVLLDIIRNRMEYPDIPAVFIDVPTQYTELKEFALTYDNVHIIKPKISFMQVCEQYGFPLISKEVSETIYEAKRSIQLGNTDTLRIRQLNGIENQFSKEKWKFMLDAPFSVSDKCCKIMKKNPLKLYENKTGRKPIIATMACESQQRRSQWINHGCNAFELKHPISKPMSFWTEQDVLEYIKTYNIKICSVYGDVIEDLTGTDEVAGQLTISDMAGFENIKEFDAKKLPLKTTGCKRTGCMLCGFGCHIEKEPNRFQILKKTHPKMYDMLDIVKNNGVTMRQAIEWINENGNMNINI